MGELETYADTRVMQPAARAVCSATLAIFALIAVFCVVNEDTISTHESADKSDGIIGDKLLRQQAQVLNDKRALKNRGKNLEAFDNMMNTWTAPKEDMELTNKLVADAPKKDPLALSPSDLGIVDASNPSDLHLAEDMNLVQYDEDWDPTAWVPHGQDKLDSDISSAKEADLMAEHEDDGMEGDSVLSAGGIATKSAFDMDASRDMLFVQVEATADWEPKGQAGFAEKIQAAHAEDSIEETEDNDLQGNTLLSSAGIDDGQPKTDSLISFVQTDANDATWVPKGQAGISTKVKAAEQIDQDEQLASEGFSSDDDILSVAGNDDPMDETELIQDSVAEWSPQGQKIKVQETFETKKATEKAKKKPWAEDDGIYGDDILSAVSMGGHKKPDEMKTFGSITDDDFDANSLLND